jgi:hypothetical protein
MSKSINDLIHREEDQERKISYVLVTVCLVTFCYVAGFKETRERLRWVLKCTSLMTVGFSCNIIHVHFLKRINGQVGGSPNMYNIWMSGTF